MIESLELAQAKLQHLRPHRKWWLLLARRSAVAIPLRVGADGLEVLMIERAHRPGDRWSGHMAFPGGMLHKLDASSLDGALRETREEIGVDLARQGQLLARLSDISSIAHIGQRRPLVITPYVFAVTGPLAPQLNHEVAEVVWVPLSFLRELNNRGEMELTRQQRLLRLPYYTFQGKRIWGLSLRMLDELLAALTV